MKDTICFYKRRSAGEFEGLSIPQRKELKAAIRTSLIMAVIFEIRERLDKDIEIFENTIGGETTYAIGIDIEFKKKTKKKKV